jgi:hypothetical protein
MLKVRALLRAARKHLDSPYGRLLLLLSCVLVFYFALHAKTAVYHNPSHIDGSTSSKLWLNGGKLESDVAVIDALLVWALPWLLVLPRVSGRRFFPVLRCAPVPVPSNKLYLARFLRPPPPVSSRLFF